MNKIEFFKEIQSILENVDKNALDLSLDDVHHKGLFSLVIKGTEFGKLTRVFIAAKKIKPFAIQLHTHRYPIKLTTIKGNIKHFVSFRSEVVDCHTVEVSEFDYQSPLNGGKGLTYSKETNIVIKDYNLPIGATLQMTSDEFHTVACSKGSIWIVEEQGFEKTSSKVLGVPFIIENLYNTPGSFQINDKYQLLKKEINKIVLDYENTK